MVMKEVIKIVITTTKIKRADFFVQINSYTMLGYVEYGICHVKSVIS